MSYTTRVLGAALTLVALLWGPTPTTARAEFVALTGFSGGDQFSSYDGTNMTIGWRFTVNSDIFATQLGFWDQTPATPLGQSHRVGLWTSAGTLLASATVLPNSPLTGSFRYEAMAPVLLSAGNTYVIGATVTAPFSDFYATFATSVTTAPEITFGGDTRNQSAGGFSFPGVNTDNRGRFGPNFQFDDTAIPEPSSLILAAVGASFVGYGWRKRRGPTGTLVAANVRT